MKKINIAIFAILAVALTGCNFLDKNPDMRASIDTKEKVQLLLVSAYTNANFGPICEFSSDQIVDNNAPDKTGHTMALNPLDKMYDEIFAWEVIKSDGGQDSPKYIWDGCYTAIATCNQALQAIEKLEADGVNMDPEKGEALVSRAYHHWILVNVFCQAYKDDELSKKDLGITYIKEPETTVSPKYERGSVYDTYKAIEEDLEKGTNKEGKWVRYDSTGKMIKGWYMSEYDIYHYDKKTGEMLKGWRIINDRKYHFDEKTGILISRSGILHPEYEYTLKKYKEHILGKRDEIKDDILSELSVMN